MTRQENLGNQEDDLILGETPETKAMSDALRKMADEENERGVSNDAERKLRLQREQNFDRIPGKHTLDSKVVGTRVDELSALKDKAESHTELVDFERALYNPDNIFLIPEEKREEAEKIAKKYFDEYVRRHKDSGATTDNIVEWTNSKMPGGASNKMYIYDTENEWNTWTVHAVVEDQGWVRGDKYLPKYVTAYHEVMHIEETEKGAPESSEHSVMNEMLPTMKTILLVDQIYKEIYGISPNEEVDYQRDIIWKNKKIKLGELANFYRDLEGKYSDIGNAVLSDESLNFIAVT